MIPSKIKCPICSQEMDTDSENTAFEIRQENMVHAMAYSYTVICKNCFHQISFRVSKSAFLEKTEQCEERWSKRKAGEAATKPENPSLLASALAFFGMGAK